MPLIPPTSRLFLAVFALYGLWGGWTLPGSQEGEHFPSGYLGLVLAMTPGVGFVVVSIWGKSWNVKPGKRLPTLLDRVLGKGTHYFLIERAGIALVLGISAALTGFVGLAGSLLLQAGSSHILLSTFFVSAGLGMIFMFLAVVRRQAATRCATSDA